jgi:Velvet factor
MSLESARVFSTNLKVARKPIDPPPIVEIEVTSQCDPNRHFLQSPYLFMICSLVDGQKDEQITDTDSKPALSGSLVSSLHRLKDVSNKGKHSPN